MKPTSSGAARRDDRHKRAVATRAVLYSEGQTVALQYNKSRSAFTRPVRSVSSPSPLNVRVRSAQPFTQAELEEYLERAIAIVLDHDRGTGPTPLSSRQRQGTQATLYRMPS
jgi:hypothetical protein